MGSEESALPPFEEPPAPVAIPRRRPNVPALLLAVSLVLRILPARDKLEKVRRSSLLKRKKKLQRFLSDIFRHLYPLLQTAPLPSLKSSTEFHRDGRSSSCLLLTSSPFFLLPPKISRRPSPPRTRHPRLLLLQKVLSPPPTAPPPRRFMSLHPDRPESALHRDRLGQLHAAGETVAGRGVGLSQAPG